MKTKHLFLFSMISTLGMPSLPAKEMASEPAVDKRPNLLYIFPDQYRLFALGIWSDPAYKEAISTVGDPVHTPNLDRLAKQGALFTNVCSTQPVSSPHRAMLLSGMFPEKNGIKRIVPLTIQKNCITILYVLRMYWLRKAMKQLMSARLTGTGLRLFLTKPETIKELPKAPAEHIRTSLIHIYRKEKPAWQ